ncbi:hypothetical protein A2U01_0014003, partial [Trifolium medium]|nr:hypothetical protein [Trifolium medium]
MSLKEKVLKPKNPLQVKYKEHFFCQGFPVISEADNEEVILNFLEQFKKETGFNVPRSMVPPAPNVDLYKPRKRKRKTKASEESEKDEGQEAEENKKEEKVNKKLQEKVGQKKEDKKMKAVGIHIDEGRTKKRQDKKAKSNDSSTESDERTLAQRLKQKT